MDTNEGLHPVGHRVARRASRARAENAAAMPPAAAAFATLVVPRLDATVRVKMVLRGRLPRPKAYLVTPKHSATVWLSGEAARDRVRELLAAFDDLHEDDITPEFEVALFNDGRSCSILSGTTHSHTLRMCTHAKPWLSHALATLVTLR
jgi:hypothetical protein